MMTNSSFDRRTYVVAMDNQLELVANNKLVIGKVDGGPLGTFQIQKKLVICQTQ